jgi:Domain of unknown function (DUF5666)
MKIRESILTAGTVVLLAVFSGVAMASPNPQAEPAPATKQVVPKSNIKRVNGVSRGTITSIDNERLVISHKKRGRKTEDLTFMLNSQTERKGDLKPGSIVSVHYINDNNQLTATAIQAMPQKTASKAKRPVAQN